MCGIAGLFRLRDRAPLDPARVEAMCDALVHRGPDGSGVWHAPGVALGHRRLSIIDLAGSPQPMHSTDGRATIVFNGEIYNFRELRAELAEKGARFATEGDTETILAAWQAWGPDCLERLDGMFAFALYDHGEKRLFLARDRLGVKPLFTAELPDGTLAFASELKGLLALPELERRIDPLAVEDYLAWGYVPDHRSILDGVGKLPAGHFRQLGHDGMASPARRWWDVSFADRASGSAESLSEELLDHLRSGVRSRMVSDVPLGAFLSGGVDSSATVALMSEASDAPVATCSIGFDVAALDETAYAERIAQRYGTNHRARMVGDGDYAHLDTIAAMFDEPFADASALPTWRVCQLARENVTVALSGDGADEALAGYRRQVFHHREEQARAAIPAALRKGLLGPLGRLYPKADWAPRPLRAKSTLLSLAGDGPEGYARGLSVTSPETRAALYSAGFTRRIAGYRAEDRLVEIMRGAPARSGLDQAQYVDLTFFLPGDILTKVDRTSMAVSLEAREPLLDHRLIQFAARLPEDLRVKGGQGKWLLKKTMEPFLPQDVLYRPKQGFVTPISDWFRTSLAEEARALGQGGVLAETGWFDPARIARVARDHIAGRAEHGRLLFQLTMLERSLAILRPTG